MIDIQIHIIHPQVFQALIDHLFNMLLRGHALLNLFRRARKKLGGHNDFVPFCEVLKRPAQILLACTALVRNRRIIKIDAGIQSPADNLPGVLFINRPGVLSVSGIAESHTAHTDTGNI